MMILLISFNEIIIMNVFFELRMYRIMCFKFHYLKVKQL